MSISNVFRKYSGFIMAWLLLCLVCQSRCGAEEFTNADCRVLTKPILFVKRFNYQGLHIYDTFYQWRPGGGIYVLENPADPKEQHRVRAVIDPKTPETLGEGMYFDPSLSYDAKKLLFSFKGAAHTNSVIYEIGVDGKGLRQLTNLDGNGNPIKGGGGSHHDVKPCYLPDGRIVFTSTRYSGLVPCANNGVAIMHIMNGDGSDIHTISVNNVTEFDPCVLPDGRIMFGRWEYVDRNALVIQSLWTMMPDGRNEMELFANNMVFPEAVLQAKPVPGDEHLVVATFAPHNAPPRGTIAIIDTRKGKNNPEAITNFERPDKPTHDRGDSCDPWALNTQVVLYSGVPLETNAPTISTNSPYITRRSCLKFNALMLIDRSGRKVLVHSDPDIDLHNPIVIEPRPLPRVNSDLTDRTKVTGRFFVNDVYASMPTVKRGSVKWLRVLEETSRVSATPGGNGMNQTFSISAAMAWSAKIYHGIVPVDKDGSVYFEAPSGRALYFQLLDQDYRLVRGMRTFIQAAPGVTRSCAGCHEYNPKASGMPRLNNRVPLKLRDESWGSGYLNYIEKVQPIFDAKCVTCHGGAKGMAAGLDLSRGWTEVFNISYEHLSARRERMYTADLIAGICAMNGTAYWSCKVFGPYSHGSGKAPLADILLDKPHRHLLTQKEREQIFAWMDSNGMYFGNWDYTSAGPKSAAYQVAVARVKEVMKEARCTECHANDKGEIRRFDQWINLDTPEMSRVLRAPLPASTSAKTGYGLALCRNRKVDQEFSRRGLIYGFGYAHAVRELSEFPTQVWSKVWPPEGTAITPFESVSNPHYRKILGILRGARYQQLARPRIDMPNADVIADGIQPGRPRQILPQTLPNPLPEVSADVDENGFVRFKWECSARTIGLMTEVYRGVEKSFTPDLSNMVCRTELFNFCDTNPPVGKVYYKVFFVSDPAETCGTCRSGAVFDYQHAGDKPGPAKTEHCPMVKFTPQRSDEVRVSVRVPKARPARKVTELEAEPLQGKVLLRWPPAGTPGITMYDVYGRLGGKTNVPRRLNESPLKETSYLDSIFQNEGEDVSYAVVAIAPRGAPASSPDDADWVTTRALPPRVEPVFDLKQSAKGLKRTAGAKYATNEVLVIPQRSWMTIDPAPSLCMDGPFSFVVEACLDEPGQSPVLLGFGTFGGPGWFLQKMGNSWRFHLSGVSCDGGKAPVGEWVRLVGVYDGKKARLYQDGKLVGECAVPRVPAQSNQSNYLGQYCDRNNEQYQFCGKIRNFMLYARVLNAEGK